MARALAEPAAEIANADGCIDPREGRAFTENIRQSFDFHTETYASLNRYFEYCLQGKSDGLLQSCVNNLGPDFVELVLGFALAIATADGPLDWVEREAIARLARAIGVDPAFIFRGASAAADVGQQEHPWWIVLEVERGTPFEAVRASYLRLARQFHPDMCRAAPEQQRRAAETRMKAINAAYAWACADRPEGTTRARPERQAANESGASGPKNRGNAPNRDEYEKAAAAFAAVAERAKAAVDAESNTVHVNRTGRPAVEWTDAEVVTEQVSEIDFEDEWAIPRLRRPSPQPPNIAYGTAAIGVLLLAMLAYAFVAPNQVAHRPQPLPREVPPVQPEQDSPLRPDKGTDGTGSGSAAPEPPDNEADKPTDGLPNARVPSPELPDPLDELRQAHQYTKEGRYREAIELCDSMIASHPNYSWAYSTRGYAHGQLREFELAIADCSEAIRLNANDAFAYNNRGHAYLCTDNWLEAHRDCTRSINLNPKNALAYYYRAHALRAGGQETLATRDLRAAAALDPSLGVWQEFGR